MQIPSTISPWVWAVLAVAIAILELHTPGSYLIWIACAAAITSLAGFLTIISLSGQLTIFAVSCVATCLIGFFIYRHFSALRGPTLNVRDLELVGAIGTSAEPFRNGQGKARIGDTVWLAEASDDMPAGTPIVVNAVRGTTLLVTRKTNDKRASAK